MTTNFNPAAWLSKMESRGYEIYINGNKIVCAASPETLSDDAELDLYCEYRGGDEAVEKQSRSALWDHLLQTGRVIVDPRAVS